MARHYTPDEISILEVRPKLAGEYKVTLYRCSQAGEQTYSVEILVYNDAGWEYKEYDGTQYVCFIHSKIGQE